MYHISTRSFLSLSAATCALALVSASPAFAADAAAATAADTITNRDDIVVTATKVNQAAPITSSVHTFEPQSIISRTIIEDSVAATDDFMSIAALSPGASTTNLGNGPGFGDAKIVLRGFSDGHYNVTIDGIPFGDSNDPTHHSTAYFPDGTYERIIIDRGPGSATDLGQASYGGNVHIISRQPKDKFFVEGLGLYGSFNSQLERLTVNTGSIGGLKLIVVGEHKKTDGALTAIPGEWYNGFAKGEFDVGSKAKVTLMSTYNHSILYQPDGSSGANCAPLNAVTPAPAHVDPGSCGPNSEIGLYGINYGAIYPSQAATSPYAPARNDWNWQDKATDFEIFRFQWQIASNISFDNKAYTYFYKNFTFEADTVGTPCVGAVASPATQCGNQTVYTSQVAGAAKDINGNPIPVKATPLVGDIPGRTKLNQYRQIGDIAQIDVKTTFGVAKVGFWYEHSASHRYGYDYDLTKLAAAGALGADYFNFAIANSGPYFNYKESDSAITLQANGTAVPLYIKYDEYTGWEQYQGYGEFEFKFLNDALTLTPGVKVQNFTRKSYTPVATQTAREGYTGQETYKPTLPYFTANYLIQPNFSIYAQFAKGFLIPALSASLESVTSTGGNIVPQNPAPTRTTNYQAGVVFAGDGFNFDADVYYIQASNSTYTDPALPGQLIQSANPASYMGVEAQLSYLLMKNLTGIVNGSLGKARDDVTGLWLANAPNFTALAGLVYHTGPLKFSYLHKFTGAQWNAANTYKLPGYSTGTAVASYSYRNFTLGVSINNVFDDRSTTAIASPTSSSTAFYTLQSPRTFEGSIKVRF